MSIMTRLLRSAPPPRVAVELAPGLVSAASLSGRADQPALALQAVEALPAGAIVPSMTGRNIQDPGAVSAALGRVLERVGGPRRIGLVVPDPIAKVSLVRFERVPDRADDLEQLIRFQLRKSAPFSIDEAQVSWSAGADVDGSHEFLVTLARRDVVSEYEAVCSAAGAYAGLVDLATFNVINAVLGGRAAPQGDWLLVHAATGYNSIAVLRGQDVVFFRNRGADADDTLADMVHQTAMYYEDRLQGRGFTRVMLSDASTSDGEGDRVRRSLEARLSVPVEAVDARAPLVGLLVRGREAA